MAEVSAVYTCIQKCFFRNRLWTPGEKLKALPDEKIPRFFKAGEVKIEKPVVPEGPKTLSGVQQADAAAVKAGPLNFLD